MKDEALRAALAITAGSFAARNDHDGNLIAKALEVLLQCAEQMDQALEVDAPKPKRRKSVSSPDQLSSSPPEEK